MKGAERSERKDTKSRKGDQFEIAKSERDRLTRQGGFDLSGNEIVVVGGDERDESEDRGVLVVSGADERLGKRIWKGRERDQDRVERGEQDRVVSHFPSIPISPVICAPKMPKYFLRSKP